MFLNIVMSSAQLGLAHHRHVFMDGFKSSPSSVAPMFPFHDNAHDWDEYGEVINPDDFIMQEDDSMDISLAHVCKL